MAKKAMTTTTYTKKTTETKMNFFKGTQELSQNSSHKRVDRATLNRKLILFVVFTGVGILVWFVQSVDCRHILPKWLKEEYTKRKEMKEWRIEHCGCACVCVLSERARACICLCMWKRACLRAQMPGIWNREREKEDCLRLKLQVLGVCFEYKYSAIVCRL